MSGNRALEMIDEFEAGDDHDYGDTTTGTDTGDSTDVSGSSDGSGSSSERADQRTSSAVKQPAQPQGKQPKQKTEEQSQQERQQLTPVRNGLAQDQHGNLVDPKTGQIIARAGSERRLFERSSRADSEVTRLTEKLSNAEKNLQTVQYLNGMPGQLRLTSDETKAGLELVAEFKKNPVETAKKVVAMALEAGHNISDILGKSVGDSVDMRAITQLIDSKLAPLTSQRQTEQRTSANQEQAQAAVNKFLDDHEYAEVHIQAIDRLLGSNPGMTPEKAYYEIRMFAVQHDLDFAKPLGPQVEAARAEMQAANGGNGRREPARGQQAQQRTQRPMPNGSSSNGQHRQAEEPAFAPASSAWGDIIKQAMQE